MYSTKTLSAALYTKYITWLFGETVLSNCAAFNVCPLWLHHHIQLRLPSLRAAHLRVIILLMRSEEMSGARVPGCICVCSLESAEVEFDSYREYTILAKVFAHLRFHTHELE